MYPSLASLACDRSIYFLKKIWMSVDHQIWCASKEAADANLMRKFCLMWKQYFAELGRSVWNRCAFLPKVRLIFHRNLQMFFLFSLGIVCLFQLILQCDLLQYNLYSGKYSNSTGKSYYWFNINRVLKRIRFTK